MIQLPPMPDLLHVIPPMKLCRLSKCLIQGLCLTAILTLAFESAAGQTAAPKYQPLLSAADQPSLEKSDPLLSLGDTTPDSSTLDQLYERDRLLADNADETAGHEPSESEASERSYRDLNIARQVFLDPATGIYLASQSRAGGPLAAAPELVHSRVLVHPSVRPSGEGFRQVQADPTQRTLLEVNPPATADSEKLTAITGGLLVDGRGGDPLENSVVVIKGNRIIDVGSASEVQIPEGAEQIDASGRTVMPGLIDAHFHSLMDNDRITMYLRNGVTTLRDPGHPLRFYQSLFFAEKPVPRVFLTGAHLDGFRPVWSQQATVVRSHQHVRDTVEEYVSQGGTGIKLYFNLPLEYFETVTEAANRAGIPVMAHLELVNADDAIRAGVEGIEHVSSFGTSLADEAEARRFKAALYEDYGNRRTERFRLWSRVDLESEAVQNVIELARSSNTIITPTLGVYERYEGDEGIEEYHVKGYENMLRFIGMAYEAGVRIAVGSHARIMHAEPGWDYQHEMELLVRAGMEPMDVIVSSTMGNARYFRTERRLGSLEPGKLADLLIIDGNPVEDIRNMKNIERVMLNGSWEIGRPSLR